MQLRIYAIRDAKAEFYNTPWFAKTQAEAERIFQSLVRDEKTMMAQFPEDYDLYYLGTYEDQSGEIEPTDTPQHILKAINCVQRQPHAQLEVAQ